MYANYVCLICSIKCALEYSNCCHFVWRYFTNFEKNNELSWGVSVDSDQNQSSGFRISEGHVQV